VFPSSYRNTSESLKERELLWEQVLPNFHVLFSKQNTPPINSRVKIGRDLILGKVFFIYLSLSYPLFMTSLRFLGFDHMTGENKQYGDLIQLFCRGRFVPMMCTTHVRILKLFNLLIGDIHRGFCRSLQLCDIIIR